MDTEKTGAKSSPSWNSSLSVTDQATPSPPSSDTICSSPHNQRQGSSNSPPSQRQGSSTSPPRDTSERRDGLSSEEAWALGSTFKTVEVVSLKEVEFWPRQMPRTDSGLPATDYSETPIGEVTMKFSMLKIKSYWGNLHDVLKISCHRKGEAEDNEIACLDGMLARRNPPSPLFTDEDAGRMSVVFDPDGLLREGILSHEQTVWGLELDDCDVIMINSIRVSQCWEGLGIGTKLVQLAKEYAKDHEFQFMLTYPFSYEHEDRQAHDGNGQLDMAVNFWRLHGFRRLGDTTHFGYMLDENHPSRGLTASEDFDPPKPDWSLTSFDSASGAEEWL